MPEDAPAGEAELRSLIEAEESRLEGILAGHLERAEAAAAARAAYDVSPEGERLRRDEQACDRAIVRIIEALRKRRKEAAGPRDPRRAPVDQKGDKARDAAQRLGQLLDFLSPGQGEAALLGAAAPADGDTAAPPPQATAGPGRARRALATRHGTGRGRRDPSRRAYTGGGRRRPRPGEAARQFAGPRG